MKIIKVLLTKSNFEIPKGCAITCFLLLFPITGSRQVFYVFVCILHSLIHCKRKALDKSQVQNEMSVGCEIKQGTKALFDS